MVKKERPIFVRPRHRTYDLYMRQTLTKILDRDPFQPFRIIMTSGDRHEINNAHLVALGQTQLTAYYPRSDRFAVLRLNQLAAIETLESAA